tara:strand:- start:140 stop:277 length:138 start_codon:yes stop_codon:yes gene_type:complete
LLIIKKNLVIGFYNNFIEREDKYEIKKLDETFPKEILKNKDKLRE